MGFDCRLFRWLGWGQTELATWRGRALTLGVILQVDLMVLGTIFIKLNLVLPLILTFYILMELLQTLAEAVPVLRLGLRSTHADG
jgi:uncharacterized SAM-binding protein YcdF (DUF218 family)